MTRSEWFTKAARFTAASAVFWPMTTLGIRFLHNGHIPVWSDIPHIAVTWFSFVVSYIGLELLLQRRKHRGKSTDSSRMDRKSANGA